MSESKLTKNTKKFMEAAGQELAPIPTVPDIKTRILRARLIQEELLEYCAAAGIDIGLEVGDNAWARLSMENLAFIDNGNPVDLVEVADSFSDLKVVVEGGNLAFGIESEPIDDAVSKSNMSKFIDGHRDEESGKWIKGPSYKPVDLAPLIAAQKGKITKGQYKRISTGEIVNVEVNDKDDAAYVYMDEKLAQGWTKDAFWKEFERL